MKKQIKATTRSSFISTLGGYNVLTVEKIDNKLTFYINGSSVHKCDYINAFDFLQGIHLSKNFCNPTMAFWGQVQTACSHTTQQDGTVFFVIFTYFRGRSHWIYIGYGSNMAICHFLKPKTNKGDFWLYFELCSWKKL